MKLLITIILNIFGLSIPAQTNFVTIGVEGALGLASLRGNEFIDEFHNTKIGPSFGICIDYKFNKTFSLRSGTYYELKGSSFKFEAQDQSGQPLGTVHGSLNLHYLTIPLLIRTSVGNKVNYFINTGPYIGFLIQPTTHFDAIKNIPEINSDETKSYKNIDIGLSVGIGFNYSISNKLALSFEVRDNLGLTSINENQLFHDGSIKTNAFYFIIGYYYKFYNSKSNTNIL